MHVLVVGGDDGAKGKAKVRHHRQRGQGTLAHVARAHHVHQVRAGVLLRGFQALGYRQYAPCQVAITERNLSGVSLE
eukprot:928664-Pyramimonas_sp.AAC.1